MNCNLNTVIVPMTTQMHGWPTRVPIKHGGKIGEVALDQLRTLRQSRLQRAMKPLHGRYHNPVISILADTFAP
jgi:mRNA interferase MazF